MAIRFTIPGTGIEAVADSATDLDEFLRLWLSGGTGPRREPVQMVTRNHRLIPAWIEVLKAIDAHADGIPTQQVSDMLRAQPAGLGRKTIPVKKLLAQAGFADWEEIVDKRRTDDEVRWRPGPKIREAIAALTTAVSGK